jgi:fumarate hydratase subunit alpha/L(+)-tartrate dehydratase alpha subunit
VLAGNGGASLSHVALETRATLQKKSGPPTSAPLNFQLLMSAEVQESFYDLVEKVCSNLYILSLKEIPPDVVETLKAAAQRESKEVGRRIFSHYLKSVELGRKQDMMVCQDTGIPIYWVEIGGNLRLDGARLNDAIVRGTERATREHSLRSSIVSPLKRENRQTSTGEGIPIIHYDFVRDSDILNILFMPKGSGSENMSFMKMLVPADGVNGIKKFVLEQVVGAGAKPCPPTIVGVGIGGSSDLCMTLAKKATTRPLGVRNPDPQLADLEEELLAAINQTGIGPQGLGGDTTALDVHIESAWTHITCNPVAVNLQCWRAERRRAKIWPDGRVEEGF